LITFYGLWGENVKVRNEILALKDEVIRHRRWLHQYPEIGFDVTKTRDYILDVLNNLDFDEVNILANTGIKAVIKGKNSKGVYAFRADMDALSMEEQTGLDYASRFKGRMHGCGHDGHMSILLGLAKWLHMNKQKLKHDVVLIFQPAEESEGGALPMIQEGVLESPKVDAIFGLHLFPDIPQGKIGLKSGPLMAQTCEFDVHIKGKSAHGAMPHRGIDALLAACYFITNLQTIITRKIDPLENALITVGKMEAGERRNILAENVKIEGMIRSFNDDVYNIIKENILNLLEGMEKSHGVEGKYEEIVYYPVVNNDAEWTSRLRKMLADDWALVEVKPLMIAEDFSYYQQKVPGVYFLLGTGNPSKGFVNPLHSNRFNFDEEVLLYGIQLYVDILSNL